MNRRPITAANNSYPPQRVPEAAMNEWAEEHGPHVNSRFDTTDDDARAIVKIVVMMWAAFLAAGVVLAMIYVPAWGAGQ